MNIAFFTDSYLPNVDGVVRSITNFRGELEKRGNNVFVYAPGSRRDAKANSDPHVKYSTSVSFPLYPAYKVALFPYVTAIAHAKKNGVQLVHSHALASMAFPAVACAKALRVPLVGTFHTLLPRSLHLVLPTKRSQEIGEKALWKGIKYYYKPFDEVIAPSKIMGRELREHGVDCNSVVPNPVDLKKFSPEKRVKKRGYGGEKIILTAGRLSYEKNVDVLIKAARIVERTEDCRLVIVGDGPAAKTLRKQAETSSNVEFKGFVDEKKLVELYRQADVFATASTFETQGLTVLEAMACGTPVAAANAMALPEEVKNGYNGALFKPFDERDAAEKILKLLEDKQAYSHNCRKTAEKYSVEKCTDLLEKVYEKVV